MLCLPYPSLSGVRNFHRGGALRFAALLPRARRSSDCARPARWATSTIADESPRSAESATESGPGATGTRSPGRTVGPHARFSESGRFPANQISDSARALARYGFESPDDFGNIENHARGYLVEDLRRRGQMTSPELPVGWLSVDISIQTEGL